MAFVTVLKYGPVIKRDEFVEATNLATDEFRWRIAQILHEFAADGTQGNLRDAVDAVICAHLEPAGQRKR